jgi:hypothetical protein
MLETFMNTEGGMLRHEHSYDVAESSHVLQATVTAFVLRN